MTDMAAHLARHKARLCPECRCEFEYKPLGRLHGTDMGKGWVRTTTHPYCVHHGDKAEAERRKRLQDRRTRR